MDTHNPCQTLPGQCPAAAVRSVPGGAEGGRVVGAAAPGQGRGGPPQAGHEQVNNG